MQNNLIYFILINAVSVFSFLTLVWVLSLIKKDAGIVDVAWGLGFILTVVLSFINAEFINIRKTVVLALVILWGLRLSLHILVRNWGKGEDYRYRNFRNKFGKNWWIISLFYVFYLQGFLLLIISSSIQAVMFSTLKAASLLWSDYIGLAVFLTGFFIETVSDYQLKKFTSKESNKDKVLTKGLWNYSRHPNYFGESLIWWGIFVFAIPVKCGLITIISPVLLTFLIVKVSGVKMLERGLVKSIPGYKEYMEKTSAFIPWFKSN